MLKINQPVFIVSKKVKGIVKEINQQENKYKVTYFINNQRETKWFDKKDLKKYRKPLQIKIKYFDDKYGEITRLEKIKIGEWIDVRAAEDVILKQFEYKLIPLGFALELPKGYEANVVPRSSTFKNFGILQTNSFGV